MVELALQFVPPMKMLSTFDKTCENLLPSIVTVAVPAVAHSGEQEYPLMAGPVKAIPE
jgi:hypothetical protein